LKEEIIILFLFIIDFSLVMKKKEKNLTKINGVFENHVLILKGKVFLLVFYKIIRKINFQFLF